MNIEKTQIILKKINRLYELIQGIGEVNTTEKDLLKAYVIDLYEAITMVESSDLNDNSDDELKELIKLRKKQEKKLRKQLERKRAELMMEDDVEEPEISPIRKKEEKVVKEENHKSEKPVEQPAPSVPEAMNELFSMQNSSELSDKLANMPISDLTKAMGINEKIFTMKELFGGNQAEMDNILVALNGLSNFDEAKSVLIRSVATKYDWTEPVRIGKAKNFIKLVKRRYV